MCFYDQHRFACGDWKWGHFRQHCTKEWRIGETCGMKMVMQTVPVGTKCKLCEKIDTKIRRRTAELDRIRRWQRDGAEFQAAVEKSMEMLRGLDMEINELAGELNRRMKSIDALGTQPSDFKPPQEIIGGSALERQSKYEEAEGLCWLAPQENVKPPNTTERVATPTTDMADCFVSSYPDNVIHADTRIQVIDEEPTQNESIPQSEERVAASTPRLLSVNYQVKDPYFSSILRSSYFETHLREHIDWRPSYPDSHHITVFGKSNNIEQTGLTSMTSIEIDDDEIHRYSPETIPALPSYASSVASVFSVGSLASSATDLSRSSGYSAVQVASATKVLLSVLQEDASLLPLYKKAMNNPRIGSDRLRRNLRRIFKVYSQQLEAEATERLEFLTSRLVMMKSGLLADSIVEKLQTAQVTHLVSNNDHKDESSDEDGDGSSEAYPVNEDAFEDLVIFREFLVKSEAFQNLQTQVKVFVTGKSTQTSDTSAMGNEKLPTKDAVQQCLAMSATQAKRSLTWKNWIEDVTQTIDGLLQDTSITNTVNALMFLSTDAFMLATDGIFIALGQLEPQLKPGMTRLRWRCSCGDRLYSDVVELHAGGISELKDHMQRTSGVQVQVSSYDERNTIQQYVASRPLPWIQSAGKKIWTALGRATQLSTLLPLHNTQCHANASTTPNNNSSSTLPNNASSASNCDASSTSNGNTSSTSSGNASSTPTNDVPQQNTLRLLACMHRDREYVGLVQDPLENIATDRTLLCFLRRQYIRHRGSILRMVSLKSIKGLHLVRFWLTKGGKVIVGLHEQYCVSASSAQTPCQCLPPVSRIAPPLPEYHCYPIPPKTTPPIPPEWLSSLITCPTDVDEDDNFILNQLPRRTCGELQGQIGEAVEGWGVYYQEAWDHDMIMWTIFILLIVTSLLFGILWSRFKMDIQGAFGVSAWITGVCGAFLVVVANYADKKR